MNGGIPDSAHLDESCSRHAVGPAFLWSARAWVIGHNHRIAVAERIAALWSALDAPDAAHYLDGMMWALANGVTRTVDINCVCNPDMSGDEAILLDLVAQQAPQENRSLLGLLGMASPTATLAMCDSACRLRRVLVRAGHVLPAPGGLPPHAAPPPDHRTRSRTLH